MAQEPSKIYS